MLSESSRWDEGNCGAPATPVLWHLKQVVLSTWSDGIIGADGKVKITYAATPPTAINTTIMITSFFISPNHHHFNSSSNYFFNLNSDLKLIRFHWLI